MKIGIAGAGTMGQGIAQLAVSGGATVVVFDRHPPALAAFRPSVEKHLARNVEKGRMEARQMEDCLRRLSVSAELSCFADCEVVIEAITEDAGLKRGLLAEVEALVSPSALIASNTSSLSVTGLAAACKRPERVAGLHFFNPAPVMPLVEVVDAVQTSEETLVRGEQLVRGWGKTAIRVKDTPAFVVNRIARPFYGESLRLLDEGKANPATIDWAMKHCGGFKMGPFELMDFIGIDVNYAVTCSVFEAFSYDPKFRPSLSQRRLIDAGYLGRKTGKGFFDYGAHAADAAAVQDQQLAGEIFERVFVMMVNEAVDALFWRIAEPEAIEQAMTLGVNYPKGLLRWGEEFGLARVLMHLEQLRAEYGEERYRPSVLLKRMVQENRTFFGKAC
jgi:3-hydroxybutyryl-CoA dehydrogenase